ncbi:RDD family protein [Asticcacaulis sp.]|uniref:RDD family protein n=1 Tax=Asticcacaulis sp. TaxID=1872648 RepID=UPI002BC608D8|nr:RDD family protein [Asticcacaulis sp.]HTM81087.1 RDD family protein [Asticcacaulis sp.]
MAAKSAKRSKRDLISDAPYGEQGRTASEILTPEGVILPFINASFGERVGALLLDWLIMILAPVVVVIIWLILPLEGVFAGGKHKALSSFVMIVGMFFLFFIRSGYFIFFEMGPRAATPGKRVMKLRVISHDGGRLTPAAIFTRNALREVELYLPVTLIFAWSANHSAGSWLAFFWALALLLLPLFNKQHARLGDFLAGTRVVHMPKAALSYDLADLEGDRGLGLSFTPEQLAYGEMELTVLEQVLRERKAPVMRAVAAKIKARINWVDPGNDPPNDENFLRAYYGALRAHLEAKMLLGKRRKDKHDAPV